MTTEDAINTLLPRKYYRISLKHRNIDSRLSLSAYNQGVCLLVGSSIIKYFISMQTRVEYHHCWKGPVSQIISASQIEAR